MIQTSAQSLQLRDVLTAGSVLIATVTLAYALYKDRRLRNREYADRIRRAAADTAMAMERWREIATRYFKDSQPVLTDADMMLVKTQDLTETRDFLWRSLVALETRCSDRILAEKLEGAYAGLYGYAPSVRRIYSEATLALRSLFEAAHDEHLAITQSNVRDMDKLPPPYISAQLGNRLRASTEGLVRVFETRSAEALRPIREKLLAIVEADDMAIVRKALLLPGNVKFTAD